VQEEIVTTNNKMIELKNYESVLIVEDAESLRVTVNNILKILQDKPIIYLNLTNTYSSSMSNLKEEGIKTNNILFIDCITHLVGGNVSGKENVIFINDPNDLTSFGIAISQFFKSIPGEKWFILYAFSILKIYNSEDIVLRFIQSIFENASLNNAKIIILSTQAKNENLIKKMAHFFERIVMGIE